MLEGVLVHHWGWLLEARLGLWMDPLLAPEKGVGLEGLLASH